MTYIKPTKTIENISETDKAYIAGIIDGEGCISITRAKRTNGEYAYQESMSMAMTNEEAIRTISNIFGGQYFCYQYNTKNKPEYFYKVQSGVLENILQSILPYLKVKKEQAKLALEVRQLRVQRNTITQRKDYYTPEFQQALQTLFDKCRVLNQRGAREGDHLKVETARDKRRKVHEKEIEKRIERAVKEGRARYR